MVQRAFKHAMENDELPLFGVSSREVIRSRNGTVHVGGSFLEFKRGLAQHSKSKNGFEMPRSQGEIAQTTEKVRAGEC